MAGSVADHHVEALKRWAEFGGVWRVVDRRPDEVTVSLCRCDGGEEVQRFCSRDASLIAYLADKDRSTDLPPEG